MNFNRKQPPDSPLDSLDFEEFDLGVVPDCWVHVPKHKRFFNTRKIFNQQSDSIIKITRVILTLTALHYYKIYIIMCHRFVCCQNSNSTKILHLSVCVMYSNDFGILTALQSR